MHVLLRRFLIQQLCVKTDFWNLPNCDDNFQNMTKLTQSQVYCKEKIKLKIHYALYFLKKPQCPDTFLIYSPSILYSV